MSNISVPSPRAGVEARSPICATRCRYPLPARRGSRDVQHCTPANKSSPPRAQGVELFGPFAFELAVERFSQRDHLFPPARMLPHVGDGRLAALARSSVPTQHISGQLGLCNLGGEPGVQSCDIASHPRNGLNVSLVENPVANRLACSLWQFAVGLDPEADTGNGGILRVCDPLLRPPLFVC